MQSLFYELTESEISYLIYFSSKYCLTKNLLFYNGVDEINNIVGTSYILEYKNLDELIEKIGDQYFLEKILYSDVLCKIIHEFLSNSKFYMIMDVDYVIMTVYDSPFIILKNNKKPLIQNIDDKKIVNRSLVIEISYLRYLILTYKQNKQYFNNEPIPDYFNRIYSKVKLNKNISHQFN